MHIAPRPTLATNCDWKAIQNFASIFVGFSLKLDLLPNNEIPENVQTWLHHLRKGCLEQFNSSRVLHPVFDTFWFKQV
jgi:hypothetical protein